MEKFLNVFYKTIIIIMIALWGIITFSSCFHIYGRGYNPLVIIIGAIIVFSLIYNFYKVMSRTNTKNHDKIAFGMFAIIFSLMLLWGLNTQVIPAYDLSHIIAKSDSMLFNNHIFGSDLYFSIYPTQIPITLLVYGIKTIGIFLGFSNPAELMIIYNALMTSLMILFIYKIGKKLTNSSLALTMMLIAALYPDFYLFIPYYYTDIVSLPFAIIGFYYLLKSENKHSIIYLLIAGILFGIGFKMRVTVMILLIAYIASMFRSYSIKDIFKRTAIVLFGVIITIISYNKLIYPQFHIELNENVKVPMTHWIMMGVNKETNGGYTDADINFSINSPNKNEAITKVIKSRLPKLDLPFFYNKLRKVWSEGDHDIQRKYALTLHMNGLRTAVRGELSGIGRNYAQIMKFTIYLLFFIMLIKEFLNCKFRESKTAPFVICIFGAIIFYLIWEALSRYSFSFLPIIILGTFPGIISLTKFLEKEKIGKLDFNKIKKVTGILLIAIIIISVIVSCIYYVKHPSKMEIERNAQIYSTRTYTPMIDNTLKQVFRVDGNFDNIQLKMMTDHLVRPTNYHYELYKNDNTLIEEGNVLLEPDETHILRKVKIRFNKVIVKRKTEFYLLFYSEEADSNNFISLNSYELKQKLRNSDVYSPEFYGSDYDINPNAETYFDGKLSKGNLYFRVFEKKKQIIINNRYFIIISFFVILIMLSNIYVCLLKRRND